MAAKRDTAPVDDAEIGQLYPFLSFGRGNSQAAASDHAASLEAVLEAARSSTVAKAREITALRRVIARDDGDRIAACADAMADRFAAGGRLFAFGNGGSSTDAADLASLFVNPGASLSGGALRPLPAYGLTSDIAVVTALSNDVGFDVVYARQIAAFARAGDIAIGFSTSGNSPNLLAAFDEAKRRGLLTVGLSGGSGGKLAESASVDYLFAAPSDSVHRIQEAQTTVVHVLWELTLAALEEAAARRTAPGDGPDQAPAALEERKQP
ncbi:MAG: D-sedoheptulose-7-phosphate isomerase [Micromonosporaceae bacterium]